MTTTLSRPPRTIPATLLSSGDALRVLQCSREGVRFLVRSGRLRVAARTLRGVALFEPTEVEQLAAARARTRRHLATTGS